MKLLKNLSLIVNYQLKVAKFYKIIIFFIFFLNFFAIMFDIFF